jgi:CheY-like chemotaxis protein
MSTILFIEDDDAFPYAISRHLGGAGHRVTRAAGFEAALATLEGEEPIDLLLTDVRMPTGEPHGFALARMARQRRRELRIIYLTGLLDIPDSERAAALGTILHKPITPDALIEAVAEELARVD